MTEDLVTTICRYHHIFCSDLIFKKQQTLQHLPQSQKEKEARWGTQYTILEMAEQVKYKWINLIPVWKLCCNYHQKAKDLAYDEVDINQCDDGDVDEFETTLQIVEQRDMLNESFEIIGTPPLKTHALAKTTKLKAASDKLEQIFKNHTHVKKVGHTSEFLFSIYWRT